MKQRKPNQGRGPVVQRTAPLGEPTELEELYRVADLKRLLKLSRTSIWRLVRDGRLRAPIRLSANVIAWRRSAVTEFLKSRENA